MGMEWSELEWEAKGRERKRREKKQQTNGIRETQKLHTKRYI